MSVVQLANVAMWFDQSGQGDPLVLLHPGGAGVDSRAVSATCDELSALFRVYTPEQRAHGRTPDVNGPLSYELMAADTIDFIEGVVGGPVFLVGYSDGAIVALAVTLRRPNLVRGLVFVAGVFDQRGWEPGVLDGEPPEFLRDSYGELSPDGVEHYDAVVGKLAVMHQQEPTVTNAELNQITCRVLVMVGDDDEVRLDHAVDMYRSLVKGELAVIPGTSHGLLVEKPDVCHRLIVDFLTQDPVQTLAPIRRAES